MGWWLIDKLPLPAIGQAPLLWKQIVRSLDIQRDIDRNLLLRYPRFVSQRMLNQLERLPAPGLKQNEGVLFDIATGPSGNMSYQFLTPIYQKAREIDGKISLYNWITWMHNKQRQQAESGQHTMKFDPRLGEWSALIIIKKVAYAIKEAMVGSFDREQSFEPHTVIHPNNFLLPLNWQAEQDGTLTWEVLGKLFDEGTVTFREPDEHITDQRYIPTFGLDADKKYQAALNGLGSLLVSLLAKNTALPDKWNPLGQQQAWMGLAKAKLQEIAVSTYTRDIVAGCFSPRNIETRLFKSIGLKENFIFHIDNDTSLDPPSFADIDDFIVYVDLALERLKNQQISVSMHQPRQLTPVSLMQLKDQQYQQLLKGEDLTL